VSLARIGGEGGIGRLEEAVREGKPGARAAAVIGLGSVTDSCERCRRFLEQQSKQHPDEAIRSRIAGILKAEQ
ncbi:MAG: hypothetical protein D6760_00630, partial [Deltaproteobacteria bacterium]